MTNLVFDRCDHTLLSPVNGIWHRLPTATVTRTTACSRTILKQKIPIVINKQLYDCGPLHTWGTITYLGHHYIPGAPLHTWGSITYLGHHYIPGAPLHTWGTITYLGCHYIPGGTITYLGQHYIPGAPLHTWGAITYLRVPLHTWGAITYLGCHEIDLLEFLKFHVSKIIQFHCGSKNHSISLGNSQASKQTTENKYQVCMICSESYNIYATYKVRAQTH